jgi:hypothetical protein
MIATRWIATVPSPFEESPPGQHRPVRAVFT